MLNRSGQPHLYHKLTRVDLVLISSHDKIKVVIKRLTRHNLIEKLVALPRLQHKSWSKPRFITPLALTILCLIGCLGKVSARSAESQ